MHSYDNVLYDPINDALVVTAQPGHNPISKMLGVSPRIHPTWFYYLPLRIWLTPENLTQDFPSNFAGSSAYDIERQALISYGSGLFELGPDRIEWQKVPTTKRHAIHHSMEYDSVRKQLVVFGDYRNSNAVWVYKPGLLAGEAGSWEKKEPGGGAMFRRISISLLLLTNTAACFCCYQTTGLPGKKEQRALAHSHTILTAINIAGCRTLICPRWV